MTEKSQGTLDQESPKTSENAALGIMGITDPRVEKALAACSDASVRTPETPYGVDAIIEYNPEFYDRSCASAVDF